MNLRPTSPILAAGLVTLLAASLQAQTYTLIDLTPNAGNGVATGIVDGIAGGYAASAIFGSVTRATLWDGAGPIDLHPSSVDDLVNGITGRSAILDMAGSVQVGWAAGPATSNRQVPTVWHGAADSATALPIPFVTFGGQAIATDGLQAAGYAIPLNRDGTTQGAARAIVWDVASGAAVDLGDGGNGAQAVGVAGGQQVGFVVKSVANAALWRSSAKSLVVLHPTGAAMSYANGTDGQHQVGYAGYDVRVRVEAVKGQKTARFYYAMVWNGTAASAQNIHPAPINGLPGVVLSHSYALAINAGWIVGYAGDQAQFGKPAYSHAIVWDAATYQSVDLNAYLPAGFVGAQAFAVDAAGNVSGFIAKADGTRHAAVWALNPAQ